METTHCCRQSFAIWREKLTAEGKYYGTEDKSCCLEGEFSRRVGESCSKVDVFLKGGRFLQERTREGGKEGGERRDGESC